MSGNNRKGDKSRDIDVLPKDKVKKWIMRGPDIEGINEAEKFGKELNKKARVTSSQIRQFFNKLKSIEAKGIKNQKFAFMMLKPQLAYTAKRHQKAGFGHLQQRLDWGIDEVFNGDSGTEEQRFKNFCSFAEAILAYHRAYEKA